jgi:hypothetical protein
MKTAFVLALSLSAACFAADPKPVAKEPQTISPSGPTGEVKRLGSVTWDLDSHRLIWTVQKGSMVNGEFVPASEQRYSISPDKALMMVSDEERGFDGKEAVSLHRLLDTLSLYCAESVVWWDEGQGTPNGNTPSTIPAKPKVDGKEKPVKVVQPETSPKPKYKVPADQVIARAWF